MGDSNAAAHDPSARRAGTSPALLGRKYCS